MVPSCSKHLHSSHTFVKSQNWHRIWALRKYQYYQIVCYLWNEPALDRTSNRVSGGDCMDVRVAEFYLSNGHNIDRITVSGSDRYRENKYWNANTMYKSDRQIVLWYLNICSWFFKWKDIKQNNPWNYHPRVLRVYHHGLVNSNKTLTKIFHLFIANLYSDAWLSKQHK